MCMYLLWFCLFPDTPYYLVQKWDLFNMARAQRVRRGGQPDKEMETLPRTTTKDTVILHINHTLRTSVWRSRIFLTLLWCPLDCTNINFCCWYTYSVILSDAILFNLLLTPVHFFSQLICLSVPLTSLSSLLFFVTTTYSLSLWLCVHVFEHYWVPLLLKCTKCTTSWKRAFVPRQKAK